MCRKTTKHKRCVKAVIHSHIIVTLFYFAMVIPCLIGFANASLWSGDIIDLMNEPLVQPPYKKDGFGTYTSFGEPLKKDGKVIEPIKRMGPWPVKNWAAWTTVICIIVFS